MSLATYANSNTAKAPPGASPKSATPANSHIAPTIARRLRDFVSAAGRWLVIAFEAIAEARAQKAMIEAELYLNRYKHASKNDDDLPVVR